VTSNTTTAVTAAAAARFNSPLGRLLLIALLVLGLLIPCGMIEGVVSERQSRRAEAQQDVFSKWGGTQKLIGPVLRVPYVTRKTYRNAENKLIEDVQSEVAYFLPRVLSIHGDARTELRRRGIFEIPVYSAGLELQGRFDTPDFSGWGVQPEDIDWKRAELMLSVSDPRALRADTSLQWNQSAIRLKPSTGQAGAWNPPGVHAPLGAELGQPIGKEGASFQLQLAFNGAGALYFSPSAEETRVTLGSNWPHPSFQGGWLPESRTVDDKYFEAQWSVSFLGRDYPQRWRDCDGVAEAVGKAYFGVDLMTPVDQYSMAQRITKYAVMTLVFTFAVIWLTEILSGARAHLIQYAFTGVALCLFGLLQLSFAEHFGFKAAFASAAAAVVLMVTLYSRAMLKSLRRALGVGGVLAGLYGYLYMILQAEDYALLGGSVALFAGLGVAMYLTRKIDWSASV